VKTPFLIQLFFVISLQTIDTKCKSGSSLRSQTVLSIRSSEFARFFVEIRVAEVMPMESPAILRKRSVLSFRRLRSAVLNLFLIIRLVYSVMSPPILEPKRYRINIYLILIRLYFLQLTDTVRF